MAENTVVETQETPAPEKKTKKNSKTAQLEEKLGMEKNTVGLMPLIETAMGVENAFSIASSSGFIVCASPSFSSSFFIWSYKVLALLR